MMSQNDRHQLTLRINRELDKKIAILSKKVGVSKNAFILMILSKEIEEQFQLSTA